MSKTIAIAGKGGVGKTTFTGLFIQYLCSLNKGLVLAVDADANANLNEVLGVEVEETLGDIREDIERSGTDPNSKVPAGISKADYMNARFENAIVEEDDYDLLVMGRTQGSGCYCFVNGLLQAEIARHKDNYEYIVVDNEAGMEHISRGILPKIDMMILVSDCARRSIMTVGRIAKLAEDLKVKPKDTYLIVNKAPNGELTDGVREEIEIQGLTLLGVLPNDESIYNYDAEGIPTVKLPSDSPFRKAFNEAVKKLNL